MPLKSTKALSSVGIIGIMLSIYETMTGAGVWALSLSHQNFNATEDHVEYATASATPAMRRWIGGRDAKKIFAQSITLVSEKYEATIFDLVSNWMYDKTGMLRRRLSNFVGRSFTHWNKLATEALELGESTLAYDGAAFFSASHSTGSSGTLKNLVTASEIAALNVGTATAPTVAEAADVVYGMLNHFHTFKDDEGEPIHEGLDSITIMVSPNLGGAFKQAATAAIITDGVGSRDNPLNRQDIEVNVVVNSRLTSTTKVYAFAGSGDPAFILQQRGDVKYTRKAEGSDYEHDTDQWEFGMSTERVCGLFCWQAAIKGTLS
jgi:hypothetical protein